MTWGMVAVAGASLVGGVMAGNASKGAADTQAASADRATQVQKDIFDKQVELQSPFREAGLTAQDRYMYLLGLPGVGRVASSPVSSPSGGSAPTMLTPQPDGSFAPASTPSAPAPIDRNAIRAELLPQFTTTTGGAPADSKPANISDADWRAHQMMQQLYGQNGMSENGQPPQQATSTVNEAGLNAAIDQRIAQQQATQQQQGLQTQQAISAQIDAQVPPAGGTAAGGTPAASSPTANFTAPGSLMVPFGQTQYEADAAPKPADFSMADFQADPGYAFRQSEGEKALTRAASANGTLGSGSFLKDAMKFNSGLASQEYGNAFSRFQTNRLNKVSDYKDAFNRSQISRSNVLNPLQSLMGAAQTATNQDAQAAQNYGTQAGNNIMGAGNAIAAGQVGSANAINNGISQGVGMYQQNQMLNRVFPQGGSTYSSFGGSPMASLLYSNGSLGD